MSRHSKDLLPFEGVLSGSRTFRDGLDVYIHRAWLVLLWTVTLFLLFAFGPIVFLFQFLTHPVRSIVGAVVVLLILLGQLQWWLKA